MGAKYILAVLSLAFFFASIARVMRDRTLTGQSRTWLMIAVIFGAVSTWLFLTQPS